LTASVRERAPILPMAWLRYDSTVRKLICSA
jgi:hypothetical protein